MTNDEQKFFVIIVKSKLPKTGSIDQYTCWIYKNNACNFCHCTRIICGLINVTKTIRKEWGTQRSHGVDVKFVRNVSRKTVQTEVRRRLWNAFGFDKRWGISWPAERIYASHGGLFFVEPFRLYSITSEWLECSALAVPVTAVFVPYEYFGRRSIVHKALDTVLAAFPILLIRECRERSMLVCRVRSDGFRGARLGRGDMRCCLCSLPEWLIVWFVFECILEPGIRSVD